jgi:glycosyltransferase involved in cell wall biosynthesis
MRIVHVTDCYLPRLGGIETHVADLVRRQRAAGHEVHVVTSTAPAAVEPDARVHRIKAGWIRETLVGSLRSVRVVSELQPDVVHCHNSVLSPLAVAVAASDLGVPTAVTVHSLLPAAGPLLPLSGLLLGIRGPHLAWSAVSAAAAAPLRHVLGGRTQVDVLPNAIDVDWWRGCPEGRRSRSVSAEVRVVTVGRLALRKRPLALLAMMALARELVTGIPVRLIVVGDGPQRARVQRRVRAMAMSDWVDLPGQLPRPAIRDLLAGADIYVAPAVLESFGIAALEARAVGLPVVAQARGGVGEFVTDGTDGVLAGTDHDMARALARLIESPGLRRAIGAHNRAVAPPFGWADALARTDALYARAMSLTGRVPLRPTRRSTVQLQASR